MNSNEYNRKDEIRLISNPEDDFRNGEIHEDDQDVDILELVMKLWDRKKKICLWCVIGAFLGLIIAFSIPKEYTTDVTLAPELGNTQKSSGLSALASMAGISTATEGMSDAVNPLLYPDVVSSVPFLVGLFDVPVEDLDGHSRITVREYVENDLRSPWWSAVIGLPFKLLGHLSAKDEDNNVHKKKTDAFQLTKQEYEVVQALQQRVMASVDSKTAVITISVEMQDPLVSAILADTVVSRLQEYITDYRTNKARKDLEYAETLNREARENYYKAQQKYADYLDRNNGLIIHSAMTTRERLQNEATLAFNLYNQTSQQVQKAKAKVQENTPVYATVSPATVPIKPTSPRKMLILVGCVFLAFVACSAWILFGEPLWDDMKQKKNKRKEN